MKSEGLLAKKARGSAIAAVALIAMLGLVGCSGGAGAGSEISNENKASAKTVIKAASNVFATTETLELTEKDSPATIDKSDPQFAEFYSELGAYKTMADTELKDCSFTVTIQSVTAATARGDSTQTNYRYTITGADMDVNGVGITYDTKSGFNSK